MTTQTLPTFTGAEELVRGLDAAIGAGDVQAVTTAVQECLEDLIGNGRVVLSPDLRRPAEDCYARRLLHRSEEHGYVVIAMIWGQSQGTPLHDHSGVWCVEAVLEGEIDVTQYDLVEEGAAGCRFEAQQTVRAGVGEAGRLIPPFEYHTIFNGLEDRPSITVHVYGEEMKSCTIFPEADADGWWERVVRPLGYTD